MTTGFVYLVFCTIFNAPMVEALTTYYAYLPIGVLGISWIVSLIYVAFKKFKVPVIVEVPEQIVVEKREKFFSDIKASKVETSAKVEEQQAKVEGVKKEKKKISTNGKTKSQNKVKTKNKEVPKEHSSPTDEVKK